MLVVVLVMVALALVVVGFVAPHQAKRVRRRADKTLDSLEDKADTLPHPADTVAKMPVKTSKKVTEKSVDAGRHARKKL